MQCLLTKGLTATAELWPGMQAGYGWIHRAAHLLTNVEQQSTSEIRYQCQSLLDEMRKEVSTSESLCKMIATFLKVMNSYWPELFLCYDLSDLPRTNNDLEHLFGSMRYHEWGGPQAENKHHLASLYEELCESLPRLSASTITSAGQSFSHTISCDSEHSVLK